MPLIKKQEMDSDEKSKVVKWAKDVRKKMTDKEAEVKQLQTEVKNLQALNAKKNIKGLGNMAVMIMPDHNNLIDHIEAFTLDRDPISKTAVAIFKEKNPLKKFFHIKGKYIESPFTDSIALPTAFGWLGFFDARTYAQVTVSSDEGLRQLVSAYNTEIKHITQDIFVMNRTAEELEQKKETWWDKYGTQLMSTMSIIMLSVSILYFASQMGGIGTNVGQAIIAGVKQGIQAINSSRGGVVAVKT